MKLSKSTIRILLFAGAGLILAALAWPHRAPAGLDFKPKSPGEFSGVIAWLVAVALFVERAVEVVVLVLRDQKADMLKMAEDKAVAALEEATKTAAAVNASTAATADEKQTAATAVTAARRDLAGPHQDLLVYRAETKEIALLVGLSFGIVVSLSGVRALQGLLLDQANAMNLFKLADIVVTGALLAGGSEGIHRLANVYTSFADSASTKLDNQNKPKASA